MVALLARDWPFKLATSLGKIHRTIWDRRPKVQAIDPLTVAVTIDTYGYNVDDAAVNAETLLRRHTPLAGLMNDHYSIKATNVKRRRVPLALAE